MIYAKQFAWEVGVCEADIKIGYYKGEHGKPLEGSNIPRNIRRNIRRNIQKGKPSNKKWWKTSIIAL